MTPAYEIPADPLVLFDNWMKEAIAHEPNDPGAACLATISPQGLPQARMVLVREWGINGFVFCSNGESAKGQALAHNAKAAFCWHWKSLHRQVRAEGVVEVIDDAESDAIFSRRYRGSQLGAWASAQSRPLESPAHLVAEVARFDQQFAGQNVPRPPYWLGYRLVPQRLEFWSEKEFRLHDRFEYTRTANGWRSGYLFP